MSEKKSPLFIALPVPTGLKTKISTLNRDRLEGNWTHPDDLHITLRYLGPTGQAQIAPIKAALEEVRRPVFYMSAAGMGTFATKRQTILYAAVESTRKITTLCAEITDRLQPFGFDFGTRPFVPHITLARCKKTAPVKNFIARHQKEIYYQWQVDEFQLMLSAPPDEQGRHYQSLASYSLLPY